MKDFTIRVSQRVYYDVAVRAETAVAALRFLNRTINGEDESPDIDDLMMVEADSGPYEIEPVQMGEDGQPRQDEEFLSELASLVKP